MAVLFLLLFFPTLCTPLVLEFFRVRHHFDQEGLAFRSPWSQHRHIAWSNVASVKWRRAAKWLDLRTHDGMVVHLSPWLAGLKPFAALALARIPSAVLTASAEGRAALQVMSAGAGGALMMSPLAPEQLLTTLPPRRDRPPAAGSIR
jgi:hypothetical protein